MYAENVNSDSSAGYCKSYSVHLCLLSFLILTLMSNDVLIPVMDDAADCLE